MKVAKKGKGPIYDPGKCRCCGAMKKCRIINVEYDWEGQKEIYSELFVDCFGLMLSHLEGSEEDRLICATCVSRLREASLFRAQVLRCEEQLLQHQIHVHIDNEENAIKTELIDVKEETPTEDLHDSTDNDGLTGLENVRIEVIYEAKTMVDIKKPAPELKEPNTRKLRRPGLKTDVSAKREMLLKMRKTREQFRKMQQELHAKLGNGSQIVIKGRTASKSLNKIKQITRRPGDPVSTDESLDLEKCMSEAELEKHRVNLLLILKHSNATLIKSYFGLGYTCCFCSTQFPQPDELKKHTTEDHDETTLVDYIHKIQKTSFYAKLDITHLKCTICNSNINSLEELADHFSSEHNRKIYTDVKSHILPFRFDEEVFKCVICATTFFRFRLLQEHMNIHFRNYICEVCDAGYVSLSFLRRHSTIHRIGEFKCRHCAQFFSTTVKRKYHELKWHRPGSLLNVYTCVHCYEQFNDYRKKDAHLVEVHGIKPAMLSCNACERTFNTRKNLAVHIRLNHLMERRHKCKDCDKAYFCSVELRNHAVKHTDDRPFTCDVCSKAFRSKKILKEHLRIHANDKRYKCKHCEWAFVQRCSWRSHMRTKHKELV